MCKNIKAIFTASVVLSALTLGACHKAGDRPLDATSLCDLGVRYFEGRGVPQDKGEAVRLFRRAAELGYGRAQYYLGFSYANGEGIPKDYIIAYAWLNVAIANGQEDATKHLAVIENKITKDQVAQAQRLSMDWFSKYVSHSKKVSGSILPKEKLSSGFVEGAYYQDPNTKEIRQYTNGRFVKPENE